MRNAEINRKTAETEIFLKLELVKKAVETSVLLFTLRYGVLAMALGQLFCDILAQVINAWPNKKLLGYPYWIQLKDLLPCLLLSLVMAGLVAAVQLLGLHDLVTLLIQVPLGVLVYTLGARLLKLDSFDYILNMAKSILQKRRAGENR